MRRNVEELGQSSSRTVPSEAERLMLCAALALIREHCKLSHSKADPGPMTLCLAASASVSPVTPAMSTTTEAAAERAASKPKTQSVGKGLSVLIASCLVARTAVKFAMAASRAVPLTSSSLEELPSGA